jgi:hypothetical protein
MIGGATTTCDDGTLVALEPGEAHSVRALEQSRLLLRLAPRPAPRGHSPGSTSDARDRLDPPAGSISLGRLLARESRGSQA